MADEQTTAVVGEPANQEAEAASHAAVEQNEDTVLEQILSGADDAPPADEDAGGRERGPDGRFKSKEKSEQKDDAEQKQDTSEPDAPPDTVNPDEYRKALQALQRAKTPQSVIDSMNPDQLTSWGLSLAQQQAETDGFGKQLSDLKARVDGKPTKDAPVDVDLDAAIKPFTEYFGDDVAEPLKQFGSNLLNSVQQQLGPLTEAIKSQEREAARTKLTKQYGLDDDGKWQRVLAQRTSDTNDYTSELDAITSACRNCFADEIIADYQAKLKEEHRKRDNGQTSTESRQAASAAKKPEDLEDDLINAIQDGDTEAAVKISRRFPKVGSNELLLSDRPIGA